MRVAVITCTVGRPEMFALCEKYVQRQTLKPDEWIIEETNQSPLKNYIAGLAKVPEDHHVLFMDDDDWYAPDHVQGLVDCLEAGAKMAAPCVVRRINLPMRRFDVRPATMPGPAMCGIHHKFLQTYRELLPYPNGDRLPWLACKASPWSNVTYVGIKGIGFGLPGKRGVTAKHHPAFAGMTGWNTDMDFRIFKSWIGEEDAEVYIRMLKGKK